MNNPASILIKCFPILFAIISCAERENVGNNDYSLPSGYDIFQNEEISQCRYKVFATYPDSVNGFKIRALMVAYIDTAENQLEPTTVFILRHRSGATFKVDTKRYPLLDVEDFRNFVNNNKRKYNDTIVTLRYNCAIDNKREELNLNEIDGMPFVFLDVSFKNYPSLLIWSGSETNHCSYYDVYGFTQNEIHKVNFMPYTEFKTQTNEYMLGYGTNINYKKKEIIIPSLEVGSCACHGSIINDHYVLSLSQDKFVHHRTFNKYEFDD